MREIPLRTSERTARKQCPQKWYWSYVEGLAPTRPANPLWFGTAIHVALAEWYRKGKKRGPHPAETAVKAIKDMRSIIVVDEEGEKSYVDAIALAEAMCVGYIEEYGTDPQWDVLFTEGPFTIPMRSIRPNKYRIIYHGTLDGAYRDLSTGEIFVMEHKTAAALDVSHLPLDEQNGGYTAMAERMLKDQGMMRKKDVFAGVNYNFLRKAMPDDRPENEDGLRTNKPQKIHFVKALNPDGDLQLNRALLKLPLADLEILAEDRKLPVYGEPSKRQPQPRYLRWPTYRSPQERSSQLDRVRLEAHYIERMRKGDKDFPIIKSPGRHCAWGCPFFVMCQLDEQGDQLEVENYKETMLVKRDPYQDHNKSAEDLENGQGT